MKKDEKILAVVSGSLQSMYNFRRYSKVSGRTFKQPFSYFEGHLFLVKVQILQTRAQNIWNQNQMTGFFMRNLCQSPQHKTWLAIWLSQTSEDWGGIVGPQHLWHDSSKNDTNSLKSNVRISKIVKLEVYRV